MISADTVIKTDVVIVGGGIAALMAAISASREGASVVLLDKGHIRRSGSGATGNDHFACYIPEFHGKDMAPVVQEFMSRKFGLDEDEDIVSDFFQASFGIVKQWEEWGIAMRPTGSWRFQGHALPGRPRFFLKYDGHNQKEVLSKQLKRSSVTVLNHHPVLEVACNDEGATGVLALDIASEEPAFVFVEAKAVILATGTSHRLYHAGPTPAYMFNTAHCPNCAGGPALALRAGASLVNMEFPYVHAGPKFFERCGKATWIGVYRYPDGRPVGPFITRPDTEYGDVISDIWNSAFEESMRNATGPIYQDCSGATPEELAAMRKGMISEGLTSLVSYMEKEGIRPDTHAVEFCRYEALLMGRGVDVGRDGQTSVAGLYCAGDMIGNFGSGIAPAAYMGDVCGRNAARRAKNTLTHAEVKSNIRVRERMDIICRAHDRQYGASWQESNFCLQQIMDGYAPAGPHRLRSQSLLEAGLSYVQQLRQKTLDEVRVSDGHTIMRMSEVTDLIDCGEAIFRAALARQESRGDHRRADYPFTNPLLANQLVTVRTEGDSLAGPEWKTGWRPHRTL